MAKFRAGLSVLLGQLLLALVLLIVIAQAGQEASTALVHSLPNEGSLPDSRSVDPPCGTLGGILIDPMETGTGWHAVKGSHAVSATLTTVAGCTGQAVQLNYHLTTTGGITDNWVQLRRNFDPPLDLSAGDHLRFVYRGTMTNTLEVGLVSAGGQNYFARSWNQVTHVPRYTYATWDLEDFRKDGRPLTDTRQIEAIFISVVKAGSDDVGSVGSFTVDELQYLTIETRTVPSSSEWVTGAATVTKKAAAWIAAQQQPQGLLKSWQEETAHNAWLYDQALGLIVLCESGYITEAERLATALHNLQNADGSWYAGYDYSTNLSTTAAKPVGAIAWTVYALSRCHIRVDVPTARQDAWEGAGWLAGLQRQDGSVPALPGDPIAATAPTEPNLDAWWAFRATGYHTQALRLQNYLLTQVWDSDIGRFKASPDSHQIFLDNQTWGAAFLRAICRNADARRAQSYARWTLATNSDDGTVCGFDGAGPFSVWNEGTLQYVAAHGENSSTYWAQMVDQQALNGGLPGSPDHFRGYIVWLTRWHGIAPTAWFYFAGTGGPFPSSYCSFLPLVIK
ncbi:MAG: hypothetical protein JXA89_14075 [Anaerolineae bacterium]|nr:hypothetical protein [Anaerolineae bacterium]